jgi:hypothetical protein
MNTAVLDVDTEDAELDATMNAAAKAEECFIEIIDLVVMGHYRDLIEPALHSINEGAKSLEGVLRNQVLLRGAEIHSLAAKLTSPFGFVFGRRDRLEKVLEQVRDCLDDHNLLTVLEDIGIKLDVVYADDESSDAITFMPAAS